MRVAYLREARLDPSYRHPAIDAGYNDDWARSIAVPDWQRLAGLPDPEIGSRAYLRPPGYPWFLAATYAVSRGSYDAPRVAQIFLGLASMALAWRIGRRASGIGAGVAFAALVGFHASPLYWEGELHEPALLVFLLLAAVEALSIWSESPSVARAALAGAVLGIGALVRPNVLLVLVVAAGWMGWIARARRVRLLPSALALLAAAAVSILPATVRNARVTGEFVLISSNSGINLFMGNHPQATGFVSSSLPGYGDFRTCYDYPAIARKVELEQRRKLTDPEISSFFTRKALAFVRDDPGAFLILLAKKAFLFWGPDEISHNKVESLDRESSAVLRHLPWGFPPLLAGALVGLALLAFDRQRRELAVLVALFTAAWFLSILPFFAAERYRAPIYPFLMFFCSVAAARVAALFLARRAAAACAWAGAFAILLVIVSVSPIRVQTNVAKWHMDRARALHRDGKPELALAEFQKALADQPGSGDARFGAAVVLGALGRIDEAIDQYRLALRAQPDDADTLNNLGTLLAQRGRIPEAVEMFERAVRVEPSNPRTLVNLGHALVLLGRVREAVPLFHEALRLDPGNAQARRGIAEAARRENAASSPDGKVTP